MSSEPPLAYELRGPQEGEPLLLLPGLGSQLVFWPEDFCQALEARGFRLILVDNRDAGLSPWTPGEPPPLSTILTEDASQAPAYTLEVMAADVVLLMDHLGLPQVHLLGNSMGGMIAQTVALGFAHRLKSLTLLMSAPGAGWLEIVEESLTLNASNPEEALEQALEGYRVSSGRHFAESEIRAMLERSHQRAYHPAGWGFQMQAILASGDRQERLQYLYLPTLIVHGRLDPLIPLAAAEAMAEAIPGAELLIFDEMGHDLSPPFRQPLVEAVAALADRAREWSV